VTPLRGVSRHGVGAGNPSSDRVVLVWSRIDQAATDELPAWGQRGLAAFFLIANEWRTINREPARPIATDPGRSGGTTEHGPAAA
jgi:hypothetical protein